MDLSTFDPELTAALREVMDPEMPVSVIDLGLIRGLERVNGVAKVQLTYTSTACPAMDFIRGDIRDRLLKVPGISSVEVEDNWDTPWSKRDMSPLALVQLRSSGVSVG